MPDAALDRANNSLRNLQWLIITAVSLVMFIAFSMMMLTMWNTYRLGQQSADLRAVAVETHDALCAFKSNLVTTQRDARAFVKENPSGLKSPSGEIVITREQIDQGIATRQEALDSLQALECEGEVIE